jgi:hypothetical protein
VTLTSTDVNTALGYTAANDANVVKLTGDQGILGIKSFNHVNGSVENFTTRLNYFFDNGIIRSDVTPLETINNLTSQSIFKVDKDGNTTANSFIKIGGNSTQYLKADGSVSTAMNSRIEVNFTATSGQTTFTTPYEVGQIDVYYNGSKLNPSEFTATNGTTVVLAQAATLNAQISIVKYVAALSTTAIRNETTFTATSGQTTFSVNYTVGQLDVFYNGSKLNVSEFTATNGTSVVLGFACQAGESVVFVSYVNQVSGASGTANRVAKFTGAASLGDSQIFDNGTNVGIGTTSPSYKLDVQNQANAFLFQLKGGASLATEIRAFVGDTAASFGTATNHPFSLFTNGSDRITISSVGNVGIGTTSPSEILDIRGASQPTIKIRNNTASSGNYSQLLFEVANTFSAASSSYIRSISTNTGNSASDLSFGVNANGGGAPFEAMRITSGGNLGIGITNPSTRLAVNGKASFFSSSNDYALTISNTDTNGYGLYIAAGGTFPVIDTYSRTGTALFRVSGGGVIFAQNTSVQSISDIRTKENIRNSEDGLNIILKLRPVRFDFKKEFKDVKNELGFIAQEVEEVFPEVVSEWKDYKDELTYKTLGQGGLIPVLVKAIQEQQAQIKELQDEIISLKNK